MTWQHTPYTGPLLVAACTAFGLSLLVWRRRRAAGAVPLVVLQTGVGVWSAAYALELMGKDLDTKLFWARTKYVGALALPPAWLAFALDYTGRSHRLTGRLFALLAIHPVVVTSLLWTNDWHELMWTDPHITTVSSFGETFTVWRSGFGTAFWVQVTYVYLLYLMGALLLLQMARRSPRLFRRQVIVVLLAMIAPWTGNLLFLLHLRPIPYLDMTPFGFLISGVALAGALFNFRLLDVVPVARTRLIEQMNDLVIVLDDRDRVVDLNPAAQQIADRTLSEIIAYPAAEVFAAHPGLVARCADRREVRGEEVRLGTGQGARYYDLHVSLLRDGRKRFRGQLIVLRDITTRKHAEQMIHQHAQQLEARNRELDAFSHAVAHDLTNLVTVVVGYTEVLQADLTGMVAADSEQMLDTIHRTAGKMDTVIRSLLLLSRLRDATETVTPIDVYAVIRAAVEDLQAKIAARGVTVEIAPEIPRAVAYDAWLEQVFVNLIDNAIKYIGADNPDPRVAIRGYRLPDADTVRYEIEDNGVGVRPGDADHLFDMFTRFHKQEAEGFGLGLSIVARIIDKLNGKIGIESTPGAGTLFWFTLPAAE